MDPSVGLDGRGNFATTGIRSLYRSVATPARELMVPSVIARSVEEFGANCCSEARFVSCLIFQSLVMAERDNEPTLLGV